MAKIVLRKKFGRDNSFTSEVKIDSQIADDIANYKKELDKKYNKNNFTCLDQYSSLDSSDDESNSSILRDEKTKETASKYSKKELKKSATDSSEDSDGEHKCGDKGSLSSSSCRSSDSCSDSESEASQTKNVDDDEPLKSATSNLKEKKLDTKTVLNAKEDKTKAKEKRQSITTESEGEVRSQQAKKFKTAIDDEQKLKSAFNNLENEKSSELNASSEPKVTGKQRDKRRMASEVESEEESKGKRRTKKKKASKPQLSEVETESEEETKGRRRIKKKKALKHQSSETESESEEETKVKKNSKKKKGSKNGEKEKTKAVWNEDETRALITLMQERNITALMDSSHLSHQQIFNSLESSFHKLGFEKWSATQMKQRYKTLKKGFKAAEAALSQSGASARAYKNFKYFDEMANLLNNRIVDKVESGIDSCDSRKLREAAKKLNGDNTKTEDPVVNVKNYKPKSRKDVLEEALNSSMSKLNDEEDTRQKKNF